VAGVLLLSKEEEGGKICSSRALFLPETRPEKNANPFWFPSFRARFLRHDGKKGRKKGLYFSSAEGRRDILLLDEYASRILLVVRGPKKKERNFLHHVSPHCGRRRRRCNRKGGGEEHAVVLWKRNFLNRMSKHSGRRVSENWQSDAGGASSSCPAIRKRGRAASSR